MTFHIAMVGCDGLVVGSDRRGYYVPIAMDGTPQLGQPVFQPKYFISANKSVICFAAGGPTAIGLGRRLSIDCDGLTKDSTESDSYDAIYQTAISAPGSSSPGALPDEVLVVQANMPGGFWMVLRRPGIAPQPTVLKQQCLCIGDKTVAMFLPRHLWTMKRGVSELGKLALLTLSYAAHEMPSSIGPPFDLMTLDGSGNITWSEHQPVRTDFQAGLEGLFAEKGRQAPEN